MMVGCPPQLLDSTHHVCQSPQDWCAIAANVNDPLCQAIVPAAQAVIANDPKCAGEAIGTPSGLYGNLFSDYCEAELMRGYKTDVNDPGTDPTQNCKYYKEMPYSLYSAYSQTVCPFVYSFSADDWNDQSGFSACEGATEMDITWCPGDP